MNLTKLFTLLFLLLPGVGFSQAPSVERTYPIGAMVKVIVCTDDLTVFALSATGKVWYKKVYDPDFTPYLPAKNLTVTDLAGYNYNEMYFLGAPDVIYAIVLGIPQPIKVLNAGVTKINDIAIVNAKRTDAVKGYYGKRDFLAVATNNGMYPIFRGDILASQRYERAPAALGAEGNWRITNSSFERLDFQYDDATAATCYPNAKHSYHDPAFAPTILPEDPPYSAKVNCTLFENVSYGASISDRLKYWGTDDGLFLKVLGTCDAPIARFLPGFVVNDLEELELFKGILDYRVIYAATDKGLYYSQGTGLVGSETQNFVPVEGIQEKVSSFAVQVYRPGDEITDESVKICQLTIWAATENGIRQIKISTSQGIDVGLQLNYLPLPMGGDGSAPVWNFCGNETVNIKMSLKYVDLSKYMIRWSDRGVFVDALQNKTSVDVPAGEWRCHVITLCEGSESKSNICFIRKTPDYTVSIGAVGSLYTCPGGSVKLFTDPIYAVQWQKDGVNITDAYNSNYIATEAGKYRATAYMCGDRYAFSKEVEVFMESIPTVAIVRSSTQSLCYGESVKLTAPDISGVTYKWSSGETTREIEVKKAGNYSVTVSRAGCNEVSNTEIVIIAPQIFKESTTNLKICIERHELLILTAPAGYPVYIWNGQRTTSNTFDVTEVGQYVLRIEDAAGCSASMTYVVVPGCSELDLSKAIVANAFSPNGDGVNDTWVVRGLDDNPDARITIYNRYGIVVFKGKGDSLIWDGKYNSQTLPIGIYYYKIWDAKSSKAIKGSITLIK
ncbi:gliding motility-associated-like protein [Pedobacter sp. UYP24]